MKKILSCLPLLALLANPVFAANGNFKVTGSIDSYVTIDKVSIPLTNGPASAKKAVRKNRKPIKLIHIELSANGKKALAKKASETNTANVSRLFASSNTLPSQLDNGMNKVPVLDQGSHGSCVTFASTAALDAAYQQGDYISQLCNLELGSFLESKSADYPSGWDGSLNEIVLDQIQQYGIISKSYQKSNGCAGVMEYPANNPDDTGKLMTVEEFTQHSEMIMTQVGKKIMLSAEDEETQNSLDKMQEKLQAVKQAIADGNRVTFGTMLDQYQGGAGALGTYKAPNDTWTLTQAILDDVKNNMIDAGHAMVITGYDDHAEVRDNEGKKHTGVITLRNSWGDDVGDHGTYYMTYDYFKIFVIEAIEISAIKQ